MIVNKVYFVGDCTNDPHAPVKVYPCTDEGCLKLAQDIRAKLGSKKSTERLEELILWLVMEPDVSFHILEKECLNRG